MSTQCRSLMIWPNTPSCLKGPAFVYRKGILREVSLSFPQFTRVELVHYNKPQRRPSAVPNRSNNPTILRCLTHVYKRI